MITDTLTACSFDLTSLFVLQDGHEICFVGDEAFRQLSQVDPRADSLINEVRTSVSFLSRGVFEQFF